MTGLELPASVVRPDIQHSVESMQLFLELKAKLLSPEDTVIIAKRPYITRSGWRKIALAFNITTQIIEIQREKTEEGQHIVRVRVRATAPNGRFSEEAAVCDSSEFEKGNLQGTLHNIESKAVTRAVNRAVSDLVGGGEVSAEEMVQGGNEPNVARGEPANPGVCRSGHETKALQIPAASEGLKFLLVTWKVRGEHKPIPDSGPAGFLRKTIAAVEKAHDGAVVAVSEVDGSINDLRVMGLDRATVEKGLAGPLQWTLQRVFEVEKVDIEISIEESQA